MPPSQSSNKQKSPQNIIVGINTPIILRRIGWMIVLGLSIFNFEEYAKYPLI